MGSLNRTIQIPNGFDVKKETQGKEHNIEKSIKMFDCLQFGDRNRKPAILNCDDGFSQSRASI